MLPDPTQEAMAVVLLDPPHPWLLPLLVLLVLLEVAAALGKRQWCQALAKEVKGLTIRKVEVMLQMNKVRCGVAAVVVVVAVHVVIDWGSDVSVPPHSWASPRTL